MADTELGRRVLDTPLRTLTRALSDGRLERLLEESRATASEFSDSGGERRRWLGLLAEPVRPPSDAAVHVHALVSALSDSMSEMRTRQAELLNESKSCWELCGRLKQYLFIADAVDTAIKGPDGLPNDARALPRALLAEKRAQLEDRLAKVSAMYLSLESVLTDLGSCMRGVDEFGRLLSLFAQLLATNDRELAARGAKDVLSAVVRVEAAASALVEADRELRYLAA